MTRLLENHYEVQAPVDAPAAAVFEHLDDPRRLGAHMGRSSWMMAGARMQYQFDEAQGKAPGASIRLSGKMLGLRLVVDEVVTRHEPPWAKSWRTVGRPRMLVIGAYEMGFEIQPRPAGCSLKVFIRYSLPTGRCRLAGWLLGGWYARWCVRSMVRDAVRHFASGSA